MMKTVMGISLRTKLMVALTAISLIPLFLVNLITLKTADHALKKIVFERNREVAAKIANSIDQMFSEKIRILKISVENSDIKSMNADRMVPVLSTLTSQQPDVLGSIVLAANADLLARWDGKKTKANYSDREYYHRAVKTGTTTISDVLVSKTTGKLDIGIAEPIRNSGKELIGFLVVGVELQKIFDQIAKTRIGASGFVYVVNNKGRVLMHPDKRLVEEGSDFSGLTPVQEAVKGRSGSLEYAFHGKKVLASYSYLPTTGWGLIVQQPMDEALYAATTLRNANIFVMIITILAIVVIVFLSAGAIFKPISLLTAEAEKVGTGDFSTQVRIASSDEIGSLANAFNQMTHQLKIREDALKKSRERYRLIVDTSNEGIWAVDTDQWITYANARIAEMLGYRKDEIVGRKLENFIFSEDMQDFIIKMQVRQQGKPDQYEFRWKHRDGYAVWTIVSAMPIFDADNQVEGSFAMITDISKRRHAEDAVQESEERYRKIMEASPDPIVTYDMQGKVLFVNPAFTRVFGWTYEEIVGGKIDYVPEDAWPETKKMIEKINRGESHSGFQTQRYDKYMNIKDIDMSFGVWKSKSGKPVGSVIVLRDVTEQKKLQNQLRQAQKMESIGILAGGIAHDFNNILAGILGYAELSLIKNRDKNLERYIQKIVQSGNRAKELIQQILSFSRPTETTKSVIHVLPIVKEGLKLMRATIPVPIEIKEHLNVKNDRIYGESTQIHQVLMNLCTNANHAMRQNRTGTLEVRLENICFASETSVGHLPLPPGEYLKLTVSDTGHGISKQHIENIFDPYFSTKPKNEGTGMGLSIVHGIVTDYGGAVRVKSNVGVGTRFDLFFPVTVNESMPEEEKMVLNDTGSESILLVDDEKNLVDAYKELLEGFGYNVHGMTSSKEALTLFRRTPYRFDIVLVDYTMPQMTGDILAAELMKIRNDIPIIMLSGYGRKLSVESLMEMGIKAYTNKPVAKDSLLRLVRKVLDEAGRLV